MAQTGNQAHRGTTVHSQQDQEHKKVWAQWKMSHIAPLTYLSAQALSIATTAA